MRAYKVLVDHSQVRPDDSPVPESSHTPESKESTIVGFPSSVHVRHLAFTLVCIAIVILLLQLMQSVLIPFVLGALLFYALDPAVDWLQRMHVPRAVGAALMIVIVVAGTGVLAYSLQGQAYTVIDQLPAGARKLAASLRKTPGAAPGAVEKVQQAADALQGTQTPAAPATGVVRVQVEDQGFQANSFAWASSISVMSAGNQLVMVLFLTYFMLLSDQLFKRKLFEIVGTLSQKKTTVSVLEDIATQI